MLDSLLQILSYLIHWADSYRQDQQVRDKQELTFRRKLERNAQDDIQTLVNRNLK